MLPKPEIGEACNRCGLCCAVRICATGSFALGLVETFGERVDGPCPALATRSDGGFDCGLILRPKDHIRSTKSVTVLRDAAKILTGAGAGCDEAGDESDTTAIPKLRALQQRYLAHHGIEAFRRARRILEGQ